MASMSPLIALFAAAAGAFAEVPPIEVRGDTACPSAAAVSLALQPLLPEQAGPSGPTQMALLLEQGAGVTVQLFGPELRLLEERTLPPASSCDERARVAAVIIASWLTPLPKVALGPIDLGPAVEPGRSPSIRLSSPAVRDSSPAFSVSAAALASVTSEGVTPGLLLEVSVRRARSPWALSVDGLLEGTHRTAVAGGEGAWRRLGVGVLGGRRWVSGRAFMEAQLGLLLSSLLIEGAGFTSNFSGAALDVGGAACARSGLKLAALAPWVGACAVGWGGTQRLEVTGAGASTEISRLESLIVVGASFGRGTETF